MTPTLIITNDFPPTVGGIEGFVADICRVLDGDVVVLTRHTPGWADHDRSLGHPVIRQGRLLLPTPRVARTATQLISDHGIRRVIFGAMAPLALLAPTLRAAGVERMLAITHGHETWWASLPGSRSLLRRMADGVDHVSTISDYTRSRIAPALSEPARRRMITLAPPVDGWRFRPADDHERLPRCVAVGRMVRQKGFGTLLRAWPQVVDRLPAAELMLVGDGPDSRRLRGLVDRLGIADSVRFTGPLCRDEVAGLLRTATVFALPVRTRLAGLNPEGLGLGFLEAAASGLPVVVGRSGGAPETVRKGVTGRVVDPDDVDGLASAITDLLVDPDRATAMGRAGRAYVLQKFGIDQVGQTVREVLSIG